MITLILLAMIAAGVGVLLLAVLAHNAPRRENRFASSGDVGTVPWIDGGGGSSDCDAGTDAGGGG
jgi:hypothetical protein